jgi:hypothetical protein
MQHWGGIPLSVAAEHLGLKVSGEVIQVIRNRAEATGVDLEETDRRWAETTAWADRVIKGIEDNFRQKIAQGVPLKEAAREVGIEDLNWAKRLVREQT